MQTAQIQQVNQPFIDPLEIHRANDQKTIKRQSAMISCVLILLIILLCAIISTAGYYVYQNYFVVKPSPPVTDNSVVIPTSGQLQISNYSDIKFNLDYNLRVIPDNVTPYSRPQIDLLNKLVILAEQNEWTGNLSDNIGFSYVDFKDEFDMYYSSYKAYVKAKELPTDMLPLLIGEGETAINSYISEARNEYLTQISGLGFNQKYIDEINFYVIPENSDRIIYLSDDFVNSEYIGSSTARVNGDYGRRQITIDPRDINYVYQDLKKTMFSQRVTSTELLKASTKMVVYHEMSHVLMQAYINLHVPAEIKLDGGKDMWTFSNIDFLEPSKKYFWAWSNNKEISDERIAQGLMLKCIVLDYSMSDDEKNDLFDILVKKDNYNMNTIQGFGERLHDQYGRLLSIDWSNFGSYLYDQVTEKGRYLNPNEDHTVLREMFDITNTLPSYIGYFNPATDKDWIFFKSV